MSQTLLVTGASGQLGQRVVELLLEAGHKQIIATTRNPEKLARFSEQGVTVRAADFDNPASLPAAFEGADRMLLISTDALDYPGHRLEQQINAIKAAEAANIKHVLYTSIQNPVKESPVFVVADHGGTEEALKNSSLGWTALRVNLYAEYLLGALKSAIETGSIFSATGDGKAAFIAREDVARAAAAALASDTTENRAIDITGQEAVSYYDVAVILTDILGKEVTYTPLTLEAAVQGMVGAGFPEPMAQAFASFDEGIAKGWLAPISTTVKDLTGQAPMTMHEFLAANYQ